MPRKRTNPSAIKQSSSRKKSNKSRTKVVCNCSRCNSALVDWRTKQRHEQLVTKKSNARQPIPIRYSRRFNPRNGLFVIKAIR